VSQSNTVFPGIVRAARERSHSHLWSLADGTGLHAPYAQLAVDPETLRLCCHLCGKWFVSLGSHVRAHGYTADSYRRSMGLCRNTALTSAVLSTLIAGRQATGYRRDPDVRENLLQGRTARKEQQERSGAPTAVTDEPEQRVRIRRRALAAGRASRAAENKRALGTLLHRRGFATLHDLLRTSYADGADLEALARTTGLGRVRLRQEVAAAGIVVRATGHNTAASKHARATINDAEAAQRVGADDLYLWLDVRRQEGVSVAGLARELGRSVPWVNNRLARLEQAPGQTPYDTHAQIGAAL